MKRIQKPPKAPALGQVIPSADKLANTSFCRSNDYSSEVLNGLPPPQRHCLIKSAADFDARPDASFVRLNIVKWLFDCSAATIWRWVKESRIPAPKKLGSRITAWNVGELRAALSRIQSASGEEA